MIIFGKHNLNWVKFSDLPLNCSFVTRSGNQIFHKKNRTNYTLDGKIVFPAEYAVCFAEVKVLLCAVAVRESDDSEKFPSMEDALLRHPVPETE
jgi:hypothetical protein